MYNTLFAIECPSNFNCNCFFYCNNCRLSINNSCLAYIRLSVALGPDSLFRTKEKCDCVRRPKKINFVRGTSVTRAHSTYVNCSCDGKRALQTNLLKLINNFPKWFHMHNACMVWDACIVCILIKFIYKCMWPAAIRHWCRLSNGCPVPQVVVFFPSLPSKCIFPNPRLFRIYSIFRLNMFWLMGDAFVDFGVSDYVWRVA